MTQGGESDPDEAGQGGRHGTAMGGGRGGQPAYRFTRPRSLRSFVAGRLCGRLLGRCFALPPRSPCPRGSRKLPLRREAAASRAEPRSPIHARYVPDRDAIEIVTTRNAGFLIPRQWIGALQEVSAEDLARLEVWPDGSAIEIEDRGVHISVHGLMTAVLPAMLPPCAVAAIFASRGGKATSDAKRSSAQANGRKGGRPRKTSRTEAA